MSKIGLSVKKFVSLAFVYLCLQFNGSLKLGLTLNCAMGTIKLKVCKRFTVKIPIASSTTDTRNKRIFIFGGG
jgi:hypothetical protein